MKLSKILSLTSISIVISSVFPVFCSCSYEICYKNFKQLAPYIHYLEFDTFPEDRDFRTLHHYPLGMNGSRGGCTAFVKGKYLARNYDQPFSTTPEFIVKVSANENRHASIGTACHYGLREPMFLSYKFRSELNFLPNHMIDGINDAGVACESNIVHYEPEWEWSGVKSENPKAKDVHMCFLVRYILDNTSSAKNAIELLKNINIVGMASYYLAPVESFIQLLISDATDTYLVEFMHNKMYVIDYEDYDIYSISTNFYLWPYLHEQEPYNHSFGTERYKMMLDLYPSIEESIDGVKNALKTAVFSEFYKPHWDDPENLWLSEQFTYDFIKVWKKYLAKEELTKEEQILLDIILENIQNFRENVIPFYWECREKDLRCEVTPNHLSYHTVIYDMANPSITLWSQENFDNTFYFEL